jgi:hypothetical protein
MYRGICYDNNDPTGHNRIRVSIPDLLGDPSINDKAVTDWIPGCMPVVDNANHPDHQAHTAAQIAALLTTTATGVSGGTGGGTVPALTVVAKSGAGTLTHAHQTSSDSLDTNTASPEHTYHRSVPFINQVVWVMFEKGDPNFPVWMGVYI